ncbi:hypothetical protein DFQ11_101459 [Winogradskyella epiphytica]|uniref:Uncharacterized protein n=1 Tax=Winogradskyella epiphytica TaxID=262005 RepID=A0A2V4X027_9FLAO|nr:hypothetical protein [Winogradskyella epiphytica]PYE83028.1 hypothetical protein DFQ11_101459 [Winogradskyella epiphytica]GGW55281.1 hypothetical protein GCM10008085_03270 [Winogradskyella epiphytica]
MKYILTSICLVFALFLNAQEVVKDGKTYEVKKEKIFLEGKEVTSTLDLELKDAILLEATTISKKLKLEKEAIKRSEKLEKEKKQAEKAQKRAEKAQKKAEKELKQKQKLKRNYDKAQRNLQNSQKKFERLKDKGKLSPVDEAKWLKQLEKLSKRMEVAKRKL